MNYFTLFNVPKSIKIDKKLLSRNFYKLQSQFHPDLFINKSEYEKKIVLKKSIEINKGYKILKKFLTRTIYLLSLHGLKLDTESVLLEKNAFLIKYFSLYEELDVLKKDNFNKKKIDVFLNKIEKKIQKCKNEIETEFEKNNYKKITEIIAQLLFFQKIKTNLYKEESMYLKK